MEQPDADLSTGGRSTQSGVRWGLLTAGLLVIGTLAGSFGYAAVDGGHASVRATAVVAGAVLLGMCIFFMSVILFSQAKHPNPPGGQTFRPVSMGVVFFGYFGAFWVCVVVGSVLAARH